MSNFDSHDVEEQAHVTLKHILVFLIQMCFHFKCANTHINLHLPIESIVQQKVMGHPYPMRLHGMTLTIVVVSDVT